MPPLSSRRPIVLLLALVALLCSACGSPRPPSTSTPPRPTATTPSNAEREKKTDSEPLATHTTKVDAPVVTPSAAPVAVLGFGDTADFAGWTMSLARMETYRQLQLSDQSSAPSSSGRWWIVWLDARNRQTSERPLTWDLVFQLQDASGATYDEFDSINREAAASFAQYSDRNLFTAAVPADGLTHPILAFDLPANTQPAVLLVRNAVDSSTWLGYDLSSAVGPTLETAAAADAKATEVAVAQATEVAAAGATKAAAAEESTRVASSKAATAEAQSAKQATAASAKAKLVISYIYFDGQEYRSEGDEYAEIENTGGASINIKGYLLYAGDPGQDFYFPSHVLEPGESVKVYTNRNVSGSYTYGRGSAIWNNKGDCGYLYDPQGNEVDSYCY